MSVVCPTSIVGDITRFQVLIYIYSIYIYSIYIYIYMIYIYSIYSIYYSIYSIVLIFLCLSINILFFRCHLLGCCLQFLSSSNVSIFKLTICTVFINSYYPIYFDVELIHVRVSRMWHSCHPELVFTPHFLYCVVVKASRPPHILEFYFGYELCYNILYFCVI